MSAGSLRHDITKASNVMTVVQIVPLPRILGIEGTTGRHAEAVTLRFNPHSENNPNLAAPIIRFRSQPLMPRCVLRVKGQGSDGSTFCFTR
jgi:hypothetical protein